MRCLLRISAIGATAGFLVGCGADNQATVGSSRFPSASALADYPPGTPAQAAAALMLTLKYNDPAGAQPYVLPSWGVTPDSSGGLGYLPALVPAGALPPLITTRQGDRADVRVGKSLPLTLHFRLSGRRWQLSEIRLISTELGPPTRASRHAANPHRRSGH